ncbi:MAG: hypothetical protein FWE32_10800 [Oscillospiraceae bacterium]|nr:hypothetical protein [Oscillospiraceae bacterium]
MERMQFGAFVFPHNPAGISCENQGRHATFFCPGHGEVVQRMGGRRRQIRCDGDFVASTPAETATLVADFEDRVADGRPGMLAIPGLTPMVAVLAEHSFTARGMAG